MRNRFSHFAFLLLIVLAFGGSAGAQSDWPQWGGPRRDFTVAVTGLAGKWPEGGPRQLWRRPLGDGYSAIAVEGNRLYTMYRRGDDEVAIALDATTGKTIWEYSYTAPFTKDYDMSNGPGPHATPLVVGDLVFTSGATSKLHALNKRTGRLVWSHDLIKEFNGTIRPNGYSCSPLAYQDLILMQVGGAGSALVALRQSDGTVVWRKGDFKNSTSSPIIINVDGEEQLVAFMYGEIIGVRPATGDLLWSHPHETDFGLNTSMPIWGPDNLLFVSSGYNGGSRVIKLSRKDGKTVVEEQWFHRLMRVHFGNCIRVGDRIYGSSGDFGPAPLTAVDIKTGKIVWRDRSLGRASLIYADNHFILLDEDGQLALATPTQTGLEIQSKVQLLSKVAWTVPTLAGRTLYIRDRGQILALALG
jgi:outer membrane protein assembly factor BamB